MDTLHSAMYQLVAKLPKSSSDKNNARSQYHFKVHKIS